MFNCFQYEYFQLYFSHFRKKKKKGDKEVMNQAELLMGLQGSGDFVSCEEDVDTDSGRGALSSRGQIQYLIRG